VLSCPVGGGGEDEEEVKLVIADTDEFKGGSHYRVSRVVDDDADVGRRSFWWLLVALRAFRKILLVVPCFFV
jgi:hypothetical protein